MIFRNLTCVGEGIVFGSIGQYKDSPDYITNVTASNISVSQSISPLTGRATVAGDAYFKSWVGVEEGFRLKEEAERQGESQMSHFLVFKHQIPVKRSSSTSAITRLRTRRIIMIQVPLSSRIWASAM